MEPQVNPNVMSLPPVPAETAAGLLPAEQLPGTKPEAGAAKPETAASLPVTAAALAAAAAVAPVVPFSVPNLGQSTANDVSATTNSSMPQLADDGDLIEKEWVTKAKEIVNKTRANPHQQSKAMTGLKVDYMQKRYQKTVKLSE